MIILFRIFKNFYYLRDNINLSTFYEIRIKIFKADKNKKSIYVLIFNKAIFYNIKIKYLSFK